MADNIITLRLVLCGGFSFIGFVAPPFKNSWSSDVGPSGLLSFYDDNFLNTEDFTTHYVVLAYLIDFRNLINFPSQINQIQHSEYIWYSPKKNNSVKVHSYTKNYFFNRNICEKS